MSVTAPDRANAPAPDDALRARQMQEAEELHRAMKVPFHRQNWIDLIADHDGYLPIEIEAVPEGTVLPTRNVLVQVVNTDPKYYWLPSYIETALLRGAEDRRKHLLGLRAADGAIAAAAHLAGDDRRA